MISIFQLKGMRCMWNITVNDERNLNHTNIVQHSLIRYIYRQLHSPTLSCLVNAILIQVKGIAELDLELRRSIKNKRSQIAIIHLLLAKENTVKLGQKTKYISAKLQRVKKKKKFEHRSVNRESRALQ